MEPSGASKEALTHMKGSEHRPAWSPDGKEIAFVSTETGIGQIYVLDLQDRAVRQLTQDPMWKEDLSWSPDGRRILYVANTEDETNGDRDLFVIEATGGNPQEVIAGPNQDVAPAWNPAASSM
ncbi:MAG TPA: hypothetical protein VE915_00280 [Actinomycetota bacterium]|nr:hypothetical protein [Actinomycetota bacterium]